MEENEEDDSVRQSMEKHNLPHNSDISAQFGGNNNAQSRPSEDKRSAATFGDQNERSRQS